MFSMIKKLFEEKCRCGSGAHPRKCDKHPWAFTQHVQELNHETLYDTIDELEARQKRLDEDIEDLAYTIHKMEEKNGQC